MGAGPVNGRILDASVKRASRIASELEAAVGRIERSSSAEIVVAIAPRSGSYRDVAVAAGAAAGLAMLAFLVLSPWPFAPAWAPVETAGIGLAAAWLVHRWPAAIRGGTSPERRRAQVRTAAFATYRECAVDRTRGRTGVLFYVSRLERRVEVVPDQAASIAAESGAFVREEELVERLEAIGRRLASRLPARADDVDELPDAPRILG